MHRAVVVSIADQALLSAFSLAQSFVLLRTVAPAGFGAFGFALVMLAILVSIHNALIQTPIGVEVPGRPVGIQDEVLGQLLIADHVFRAGAALATAVICALAIGGTLYVPAATAMVATSLWRETQRGVAFSMGRVRDAITVDALMVAGSVLAIAALWRFVPPVEAMLLGLAIGNGGAVLLSGKRHKLASVGTAISAYRGTWRESRWTLFGAATTEAQSRGYTFVVQSLRGVATLGEIQAGRVLIGPLPLLAGAWGRIARPAMNAAFADGRPGEARRILGIGLAGVLGLCSVYLAALWLAWPYVEPLVFHGRYPDIALMTAAWGLATLVSMGQVCLGYFLQASRQFRPLAFVSVGASAVSLASLAGLAWGVPPVFAVFAVMAGEVVAVVWSLVLVVRSNGAMQAFPAAEPARSSHG